MRKYLLPETGTFYKANLHCHSTVSDGHFSPETLKAMYKARGYSIIAFTDHDVFIPHPELRDPDFLPLHGYEMEIDKLLSPNYADALTSHFCFIALDETNRTPVCWHRTKYHNGGSGRYAHLVQFDPNEPDYEREYTPACINDMIRRAREKNFFVTYNHPSWSRESYPAYSQYHGMNAMEMSNSFAALEQREYNSRVYEDFLQQGKRIFCINTDDNHNHGEPDTIWWDSFRNFTMIKAEKLDYPSVAASLLAGNFYASQGPLIDALYFEDGMLRIACPPVERILFTTGRRRSSLQTGTFGEFRVMKEDLYVRITLIDRYGNTADTNAYFADELLSAGEDNT